MPNQLKKTLISVLFLLVALAPNAWAEESWVSLYGTLQCPPSSPYEDGDLPFSGSCDAQVELTNRFGVTATNIRVFPACTDPAIQAVPRKPHMVIVPDEVTRPQVWLHFGGTGAGQVSGNPTNNQNIGTAAASLGYRYIGLSYPNRRSISDRCSCPGIGPRPPECAGVVRASLLYGLDGNPWFEMTATESLVYRLARLLEWLALQYPDDGWDEFLTETGEPLWSRFAISGFSQGGGMAGMLSRDKPVERAVFFSKGGDQVMTVELDPGSAQACSAHEECSTNTCCTLANPSCEQPPVEGGICMIPTPAPWVYEGRDIDGDGLGDGAAGDRALPGSRQFAIVHSREPAWLGAPEAFNIWSMGGRESFREVRPELSETGSGRLFSTNLPPAAGGCSLHQSMAVDSCQPIRENGLPKMYHAWRLMMSSDWVNGDGFDPAPEPEPKPTP